MEDPDLHQLYNSQAPHQKKNTKPTEHAVCSTFIGATVTVFIHQILNINFLARNLFVQTTPISHK